eukprot:scaffold1223_cov136-Isochrysis_galbana.AAC.9
MADMGSLQERGTSAASTNKRYMGSRRTRDTEPGRPRHVLTLGPHWHPPHPSWYRNPRFITRPERSSPVAAPVLFPRPTHALTQAGRSPSAGR